LIVDITHLAVHSALSRVKAYSVSARYQTSCMSAMHMSRDTARYPMLPHNTNMNSWTRLGDRYFVTGPCLSNSLPVALRDRDISLVQFNGLLKTLWFV